MLFFRIRTTLVTGLLCAALAACGAGGSGEERESAAAAPAATPLAAAAPDSSEAPARPKVVVLGDSLTAGLGLLETQAFPALLQQKIDREGYQFEVENAGVS